MLIGQYTRVWHAIGWTEDHGQPVCDLVSLATCKRCMIYISHLLHAFNLLRCSLDAGRGGAVGSIPRTQGNRRILQRLQYVISSGSESSESESEDEGAEERESPVPASKIPALEFFDSDDEIPLFDLSPAKSVSICWW